MKLRIVEDKTASLLMFEVYEKSWWFGPWQRIGSSNTLDGANYIISGHLGVELVRAKQEGGGAE